MRRVLHLVNHDLGCPFWVSILGLRLEMVKRPGNGIWPISGPPFWTPLCAWGPLLDPVLAPSLTSAEMEFRSGFKSAEYPELGNYLCGIISCLKVIKHEVLTTHFTVLDMFGFG